MAGEQQNWIGAMDDAEDAEEEVEGEEEEAIEDGDSQAIENAETQEGLNKESFQDVDVKE